MSAPPRLRGARASIVAAFAVHAAVTGSLGPRIPAIKSQAGLSDGELGLALAGFAFGLFVGTRLAGRPLERFGSRSVIRAGIPVLCATLVGPGVADTLPSLTAAFALLGAASGLLDVAINANAVAVERGYRRPILASIHGTWSAGLLAGAGVAAGATALDVRPSVHFAFVAIALGSVSVGALRGLLPSHAEEPIHAAAGEAAPRRALRSSAVLLLGLVGFSSYFGEGAAADWSAVYLHESLDSGRSVAALAFVAFAAGMATSRFVADRLSYRFGPVALVRGAGVAAAVALALGLVVPDPGVALASFALFGAAVAPVVPIAFSAAGNTRVGPSGTALGWVVTISYLGSILGPLLTGLTAEWTGLRAALGIPAALALAIASCSPFVRAAPGGARAASAPRARTRSESPSTPA